MKWFKNSKVYPTERLVVIGKTHFSFHNHCYVNKNSRSQMDTMPTRRTGRLSVEVVSEFLNLFNNKSLYYIIFIAFLFSACSKKDAPDIPIEPTLEDSEVPVIVPIGDEAYLNSDSDYIFDQKRLHTFELIIPDSDLTSINSNPAAELYVEAILIFEGDTISPVGVRYKGSIGAFVNCVSGNDWANPSGHKTCTKLSMKVKINWEGREEKFYKLKKLQFHSQNNDPSQMHDRLGYWLFREMGVPSPRSVHAKLKINGKYVGLFALTEQIDGRFVKYHFKDDGGNLYKEIWPLNMDGEPYPDFEYINALKTNEDDNPSIELIKKFGQDMSDASIFELKDLVSNYMDIDKVLAYAVVDRTIRHDDGPFHWYCFDGECRNHNFYWYEEPTDQKLHLIPWDLDNAFENIINDANPITPIADEWGEISNNCEPFKKSFFGAQQKSASCDRIIASWTLYDDVFSQKKNKLLQGPMSESSTNEMLDRWSEQIRDATLEANLLYDDAISINEWESALQELKNQLDHARNN